MAPEGWDAPVSSGVEAPVAAGYAPAPMPSGYELRPLSLGEVLDRTFTVYRSRFWLFAGIASITGAASLVLNLGQMLYAHFEYHQPTLPPLGGAYWVFVLSTLLVVGAAFGVSEAATVYALSEVYLGHAISIAESVKVAGRLWLRILGIVIWQYCAALWPMMVMFIPGAVLLGVGAAVGGGFRFLGGALMVVGFIGGIVAMVILFIRNSLAVPAAVIEGLPVRPSMRRSKVLVDGTKGRIFVLFVLTIALYTVVGVLQAPLAVVLFQALKKGQEAMVAQMLSLLINFVGHAVVAPIPVIGLCIFYFDQRVRKEALDLVMMMGDEVVATPVVEAPVFAQGVVEEPAPVVEEPVQAVEEPAAVVGEEPGPGHDEPLG